MTVETLNETTAIKRIRAAFDPTLLRDAGARLIDRLADQLETVQSCDSPVLNWIEPQPNAEFAAGLLPRGENASLEPEQLLERFSELVATTLSRGNNLHHPHYVGHQVPASIPIAGLFDALASITNQVTAIYEMSPWATATESALVDALGEQFGLQPGTFAGIITSGGSLANTTALLTARNVALPDSWEQGTAGDNRPVLVAHAEAHYCIARTAGILGLGTNQVVKAALDDRRRMDPAALDAQLTSLRNEGRRIVAVVACACATPVGAFDPLEQIADVCEKHNVWLHVDAAHGGAACFSDKYRHLVAGLERADSFICDAHKMMFMPALCAFVFYRDRAHRFETFRQDAPYLFDPSAPGLAEFDGGLKTVECTRRASAYALWGIWSMFGKRLFADLVDVTFDLGKTFHGMLAEADDFEPLHDPECNIVVFRHIPERLRDGADEEVGRFQSALRRAVIESGAFYLVPTTKDGIPALRITIINPLTTAEHLGELLETLRTVGDSVEID